METSNILKLSCKRALTKNWKEKTIQLQREDKLPCIKSRWKIFSDLQIPLHNKTMHQHSEMTILKMRIKSLEGAPFSRKWFSLLQSFKAQNQPLTFKQHKLSARVISKNTNVMRLPCKGPTFRSDQASSKWDFL